MKFSWGIFMEFSLFLQGRRNERLLENQNYGRYYFQEWQ